MSDWPFDDEDAPTAEELAEAQALAQMLEAGPVEAGPVDAGPVEAGPIEGAPVEGVSAEDVSEQVRQSAALLAFAADGADLSKERKERAKPHVDTRPKHALKRPMGIAAASVVLAAAAAAILYLRTPQAALPSPSAQLLHAQARAAQGGDPAALDDALHTHRRQLLVALRGEPQ